ncbi:MarR family winged helix-turn-helix transcriptional regulator [Roseibium aggregatum]|uniref:MarR family transcriptional regulator n=1 Tax=Roseibium aggregatum TaxID=187304 RepID=A0A939ECQ5_9HYPH|nr:MarR family transcriptional regulator [Roseibium aggregatum]MBN9670906.1 MarR family transcriptional regulator [Roseibium aggregatum]
MSETTDQMSLLDAIGFSVRKETEKAKQPPEVKGSGAAAKPRRKKPARQNAPDVETETDIRVPEQAPSAPESRQEPALPAPEAAVETDELPEGPLPLDKYLCFALYSANHAMHGVYKVLLKEIGLTYPQFLAMTVLWETNNVPVGAITSKLQLDTNTLTPLLKRLEAMELLTRTRNVKDERQVILKLTRKGRALQKKTAHFGNCVFGATGMQLEEVADLQRKIMKLRDNLRQAEPSS